MLEYNGSTADVRCLSAAGLFLPVAAGTQTDFDLSIESSLIALTSGTALSLLV